ncbi:MAG: hypothetical protein ACKVX9_05360 [Blastocatellia bacterium]
MSGILRRMARVGGSRIAVKAAKAMPIVGTAIVIGLVGAEIRKKGIFRGIVNTALDATPVVGVAKNAIELFTGDWLRDREEGGAVKPFSSQTKPELQ